EVLRPEITGRAGAAGPGQRPRAPLARVFGAGATFLPATREGCSTRATVIPCAGSAAPSARRSRASMPPPAPWPRASTSRASPWAGCQVTRASPASVPTVPTAGAGVVCGVPGVRRGFWGVTSEECARFRGRQLLEQFRTVVADVADRRGDRVGAHQAGGRRREQRAQVLD